VYKNENENKNKNKNKNESEKVQLRGDYCPIDYREDPPNRNIQLMRDLRGS
jgi:hypothetical protein